jgi:hypothetical protein
MPQDDDFVYKKDLSEERIQEIQKETAAYRYNQNCIMAAFWGMITAFFIVLLLDVSPGILYILVAGLGAAAGYAFYALGKYLEEKDKDNSRQSPD